MDSAVAITATAPRTIAAQFHFSLAAVSPFGSWLVAITTAILRFVVGCRVAFVACLVGLGGSIASYSAFTISIAAD